MGSQDTPKRAKNENRQKWFPKHCRGKKNAKKRTELQQTTQTNFKKVLRAS